MVHGASSIGYASSINTRYYDGDLPPSIMEVLLGVERRGPEIQELTERIIRFASESGIPAKRLSPLGLASFGDGSAESRLPALNGGHVPPLTLPGRHGKLDELIQLLDGPGWRSKKMLDYGCGYPPVTTVDFSNAMPGWRIVGLDPLVQPYFLYSPEGDIAIFDAFHRCLRLTPNGDKDTADRTRFFADTSVREHFLQKLLKLESHTDGTDYCEYSEEDWKLVANPFSEHRSERVNFVATDSDSAENEPFSVVRCMNVFMYMETRTQFLESISKVLEPDGMVIAGRDAIASAEATLFIYRFYGDRLRAEEFCFSVDCLRPSAIMPWYTFYDTDPDTVAMVSLSRVLRQNREFSRTLDSAFDDLWRRLGWYEFEDDLPVPVTDFGGWAKGFRIVLDLIATTQIQGVAITDLVVEELVARGIDTRKNEIGFISVVPESIPAYIPR